MAAVASTPTAESTGTQKTRAEDVSALGTKGGMAHGADVADARAEGMPVLPDPHERSLRVAAAARAPWALRWGCARQNLQSPSTIRMHLGPGARVVGRRLEQRVPHSVFHPETHHAPYPRRSPLHPLPTPDSRHADNSRTNHTIMGKDGKVEGAAWADLGTTYSCVGIQNDRVEIIANDQGNRTTPSFVAFTDTERMIGDAKNQAAMNPKNTIFDAKRLIGRKFSTETQSDLKHFLKVFAKEGDRPCIQVEYKGENKDFFPEEISSWCSSR